MTDFFQSAFANATLPSAIAGGCLIGLAAVWLYLSIGRIAGISGIAARALREFANPPGWPLLFVLGLGIGGWLATLLISANAVSATLSNEPTRWPWLIAGGLLVGYGTRLGSGCTSGHGVCGIARLSPRSLAATCMFVGVGMAVATLVDMAGV